MNLKNKKVPFIIAEIGNNHEGSYKLAKKLISETSKAGVNAVKFQTFQTEDFINSNDKQRFKRFELTKEEFSKLAKFTKKRGMKFISTPLDINSAKFLNKIVDIFKISSGDNNYFDLIKKVFSFKKQVIISSGLLNYLEIETLIKFIKKNKFPLHKVFFLHCVSDYPVKDLEANLLSIKFLKDKYKINIGYSDHTLGIEASIVATALGAQIIEKHFTIDKNFSNFRDHALSADTSEMIKLVKSVRRATKMLGNLEKKISSSEKKNVNLMRRSLYFKDDIKKNQKISKKHFKVVRPYAQIEPNKFNEIINKYVKFDQQKIYQFI